MSSEYATDYHISELMIATIARHLTEENAVFNGAVSFIPVSAFMLARLTHAPGICWAASAVAVDSEPRVLPGSTLETKLWTRASAYLGQTDQFWTYVQSNRLNTFCMRGAQIDQYGNINNTVIGSFARPKVRLPGSGGMADMAGVGMRAIIWSTTHNRRTFVERVDFITYAGYLTGGDAREKLGLWNGPELVVTNLCTMDFEPASKRMRLRSLHPGVALDDVLENTGFKPVVPDAIPMTEPPTREQVELIRTRIDPDGVRMVEFR